VIPLEGEIATRLRRHRLESGRVPDGAPVFADRHGNALARWGRVRFGFSRIAEVAGLPGVTPHVLRHTHATWLASIGLSPPVAAARLGHADGGATFMRVYVHPTAADGEAALQALTSFRRR